jgi:3-oxoacyl-[acyl-carrier protein] reductase
MDAGLENRVAFVAGASSGLGRAAALALVQEGAQVAICSRDRSRIDRARQSILEEAEVGDDRVLALVCDVTEESHIAKAMLETVTAFGGLNILVTNAGGPPTGYIDDFDAGDWRNALELNFMSTVNLCRHALPHLREAAEEADDLARIIMVTSISAKQPIPNLYLSNSSRAGVQGFAKSLAEEVGAEGITVNTVLPGYTRTARLENLADSIRAETGKTIEEVENEWADNNALNRLGTPEEFAAAVTFLASKPAAYITGVALPVDGGRSKSLL